VVAASVGDKDEGVRDCDIGWKPVGGVKPPVVEPVNVPAPSKVESTRVARFQKSRSVFQIVQMLPPILIMLMWKGLGERRFRSCGQIWSKLKRNLILNFRSLEKTWKKKEKQD